MSKFFEDPALYQSVLENLPIGVYVLDREQRVQFWNRGAEEITGYLSHEVMGQVVRESLPHCDLQGNVLAGDNCSVTTTFRDGRAAQNHIFTLHKRGHRLGVRIRTFPLLDGSGITKGVAVVFEEAPAESLTEVAGALLCGCLDPVTGVSSQRLTRAVFTESLAELEDTHGGWGLLRVRILGLKEMAARYGTDSLGAFLRTAAQTIRHSLRPEDFLGRWGEDGFLAMLHTASPIKVSAIKNPAELPYKELKIDIALECTGLFTARDKAKLLLDAGAKRVLVSAPADGADITVVYGVNHDKITKDHLVISNASCTTNCLAPVAKVLHEAIGIEKGIMTTIHAYTGDQPTLDTMHKDLYRARAAALSMIPTSTGAAKAVGLVLPELNGKLDGYAIRVPTPNVSAVDLKFIAKRATTKDEVHAAIKAAADGPLKGVLGYTSEKLVSIDFNHVPLSSCFHLDQTKVMDGNLVSILSWYDNEWGFSGRMTDVASAIGKLL